MRRAAGFTLMEVMVSLAIVAGMLSIVWGSFSLTTRTKKKVEQVEARYHQLRLVMTRMAREISMAYLSKNDQVGAVKPRTLFVHDEESTVDDLMFSNVAHTRLAADAKESDQCVIRYYAATDPENPDQTNLMRRESRRLGDERPGEEGPAYVMLEDVKELHYEFFDEAANEWKETWNTTSADGQPDRLPSKVKIKLTLKSQSGEETTFLTATRIFMQDALMFSQGQ